MAKTFMQMVQEAKAAVPDVSLVEAQRLFQENPDALLLEVRDAENIPADQKAHNMVNISLGSLPIRADLEVPEDRRDIRLADRSRQVITTCGVGNLAAMGAKLLKEMGFTFHIWMVVCRAGRAPACPRNGVSAVHSGAASSCPPSLPLNS